MATFTAAATGDPATTVQWQVTTNGGKSFTDIPGATGTTLTLSAVQPAQNGDQYQAVFTNASGPATTTAATLTVNFVTVTADPSSQTVDAGQSVTFSVAASANPSATVQWQVSTDGGTTFTNMVGATSTTLTFAADPAENGNRYQAVFSNSAAAATTTAATLTVDFVTVTTGPSSQTVTAGQSVTLTAAATANPSAAVQWQVSTDGGTTFTDIAGATSTTLTLATDAAENGYQYQAVFTNASGSVATKAATLTVDFAPTVTTDPSSQTVTVGQSATFTAAASANPSATVQWQVSTDGGATFTNLAGATSTTLSLVTDSTQDGNRYRAVFTDATGTATTTAATLTVQYGPQISTQPSDQTVVAGQTATFTATAMSDPSPTVQWQVSTDGGQTFGNIAGATSTTLSVTTDSTQDGNQYQAVFTNALGTTTTAIAHLTVQFEPEITLAPTSIKTFKVGEQVTYSAAALSEPAATVQWQVSTNGGTTFTNIAGADAPTYTFNAAKTARNTLYQAVFTNALGTATTSVAYLAKAPPALKGFIAPRSQHVAVGNSVTFTAGDKLPGLTVQWQVKAVGASWSNIAGATSPAYTFTTMAADDYAQYRALVGTGNMVLEQRPAARLVLTGIAPGGHDEAGGPDGRGSGALASFTAEASGSPTLQVQWQVSTDGGTTFEAITKRVLAGFTTKAVANVLGSSGQLTSTLSFVCNSSETNYVFRAMFKNLAGGAVTSGTAR